MKLPEDVKNYFKMQGSLGGKKSSARLTVDQRKERAKKAIMARWNKQKTKVS